MDKKKPKKKICIIIGCGKEATKYYYEFNYHRLSVHMLDIPVCDKHFEEYIEKGCFEKKDVKNFDWSMSWEYYEKAVKEAIEKKPELKKKFGIIKRQDF